MKEIGQSFNQQELESNPRIEIKFRTVASDKHPNRNEDSIFILPQKAVGIFDGVGGYAGGNIASEIASQICSNLILSIEKELTLKEATAKIREILFEANQAVNLAAKKKNNHMGTTASIVYIWEDPKEKSKAIIGNVGDSRVYLFRDSNLTQITLDDNFISLSIEDKKTAYEIQSKLNNALDPKNLTDSEKEFFNLRNKITQALGQESIIPRIYIIDLEPKDRLIVCSDGISDNLTDNEISQILKSNSNNNKAVEKLIQAAQRRSRSQHFRAKPDDMTVAIIE